MATHAATGSRSTAARRPRVLVLCTHNSARSQMAEGWIRRHAQDAAIDVDVWSAGTEATQVKSDAIEAMAEVGIDISHHASKTLWDLPEPWAFDVVVTVCDSANEACPAYPAQTTRLHVSFPDPSGHDRSAWGQVRDRIGQMSRRLVDDLAAGRTPTEASITPDVAPSSRSA